MVLSTGTTTLATGAQTLNVGGTVGGDLSTTSGALTFAATTVGGNLLAAVNAGADSGISQTGAISVGGTTMLTADTSPEQVADLSTQANDFRQAVSAGPGVAPGAWKQVKLLNADTATGLILGDISTTSTTDSQISVTSLGKLSGPASGEIKLTALGPSKPLKPDGINFDTLLTGTINISAVATPVNAPSIVIASPLGLVRFTGKTSDWTLGGTAPDNTQAASTDWHIVIGGVQVQAGALGSALVSAVGAAQASALAAAAGEAKKSFGTDSVAQQIDYGFAGDIGVAPTMAHQIPLEGETISVPACTTESKNAQACK
ncbi:MAG: hypothetical protein AAB654_01575 [Acidobacteriota bacterium]